MPLLGSFGAGGVRNFGFTAGGGPYAVDYVVVAGGGNSLSSSYAFGTGRRRRRCRRIQSIF